MKQFYFKLEKILSLRMNTEKEAKIELGRAIGILTDLENRIMRIAGEKVIAAANRFAKGNGATEIRNYDMYILRLDKTKDDLLEQAAKAELAVEEARQKYIEASRERKVLDKLKEHREKEYRKAALAEEILMIDDISGGRSARTHIMVPL